MDTSRQMRVSHAQPVYDYGGGSTNGPGVGSRRSVMVTRSKRRLGAIDEDELWELVRANPAVTYVCEPRGDFAPTFISDGVANWLGWEPCHFLDDPSFFARHVHPDDRDRVFTEAQLLGVKTDLVLEYRFQHRDGRYRWVRDAARMLFDTGGRPRHIVGHWFDVTAAKETEAALRASEQELRLVTDALPVLIDFVDPDLRYRFANHTYRKWFGMQPADLRGAKLREILGDHAFKLIFPYTQRALAGEAIAFEATVPFKHGGARAVHVSYVPKLGDDGAVAGFYSVVSDISDRRRAEARRRESEERLRLLADAVPVLINYFDTDLRYRLSNRSYYDWFRVLPEEITGRSVQEVLGDEAFAVIRPHIERVLAGEAVRFEATMPYRYGEPRHVRTNFVPHIGDDGEVQGIFALVADISNRRRQEEALQRAYDELEQRVGERTADIEVANQKLRQEVEERRRAEEELRRSEARYRRLYERAPVMMQSVDRAGRLVQVNNTWLDTLGYDYDEVIGERVTKFMPRDAQRYFERTVLPRFLATGVSKGVVYQLRAKSGELIDVDISAFAERDDEGGVARSIAVMNDVTARNRAEAEIRRLNAVLEERVELRTAELNRANVALHDEVEERKRTEQALRDSEEILRTVIEGATGPIFFKDANGTYRMVNTAGAATVGLKPEDMVGKTDLELMATDYASKFRAIDVEIMAGGETRTFEEPFGTVFGERRMLTTKSIVHAADGEVLGIIGVAQDITELLEAEKKIRSHQAELAHVARLSTMGEIATTLAHELNQPLAAIANYSRGSIRRLHALDDPRFEEILNVQEHIAAQAERAGEIIRHIRKYARKTDGQTTMADINEIVHMAAELLELDTREQNVTLRLELRPELPPIAVDVIEIEQVLVNLIRNGMDAYDPPVGPKPEVLVQSSVNGSRCIEIAVTDWGRGLPRKVGDLIFDPFFTTKQEGMGMGLSISRTIVESHGGVLWASANAEQGATFRFTLPAQN